MKSLCSQLSGSLGLGFLPQNNLRISQEFTQNQLYTTCSSIDTFFALEMIILEVAGRQVPNDHPEEGH